MNKILMKIKKICVYIDQIKAYINDDPEEPGSFSSYRSSILDAAALILIVISMATVFGFFAGLTYEEIVTVYHQIFGENFGQTSFMISMFVIIVLNATLLIVTDYRMLKFIDKLRLLFQTYTVTMCVTVLFGSIISTHTLFKNDQIFVLILIFSSLTVTFFFTWLNKIDAKKLSIENKQCIGFLAIWTMLAVIMQYKSIVMLH